jgi:hypothetical protein
MTTSRGGWSLTENVVIAACVSLDEPAIRRFHRNPQLRMDITLNERVQLQSRVFVGKCGPKKMRFKPQLAHVS